MNPSAMGSALCTSRAPAPSGLGLKNLTKKNNIVDALEIFSAWVLSSDHLGSVMRTDVESVDMHGSCLKHCSEYTIDVFPSAPYSTDANGHAEVISVWS